ncbi:DUF3244 domain-containing protein [Marinilabilia rubra]|uniref:DUF3244 domain-containing protein n=1 Tax=Marinilabilia rubra TaxID=2162893 RepID=A0A2U2B4Q4_9BACT|nr:DUF3244 domain-containing protein [Marinilabilia rubra]PWD98036.1 hypothetical protein DDZ16_17735 [Marinilabilia rubra]
MNYKMFILAIVLLIPVFFASPLRADEEPSQEEQERVDLLRTRDIIIRSFSMKSFSTTKTLEVSVEAAFDESEMSIFVSNYYGEVVVNIDGQLNGSSVSESFYVNGSSECSVDISSLEPGEYTIEIDTADSSFVGKFVIEN